MIRVAVVGGGRRGLEHAAALEEIEGMALACIVDPDPAARLAASPWTAVATTEELPDPSTIDVVVIATPPLHRAQVIDDVLHTTSARLLLAEKPLALDLGEGERAVQACSDAGVELVVGHHWRHAAGFRAVHDAVRSGAIGRVELLHGSCFGNLLDQGSHVVDAFRWMAGAEVEWAISSSEDDPSVLSALVPADLGWYADPAHPAPAWTTNHLGLAGGIRATFDAGLLYHRREPAADDWRQARVVVRGTEGWAEADVAGRARLVSSDGARDLATEPLSPLGPTIALHVAVRDSLLGGAAVQPSGADALRTLEVIHACLRSAETGRLVRLPLDGRAVARVTPARRRHAIEAVSVVINVDDDRGGGPEAIASWRCDQGYDGKLELVLVSDGKRPRLDAELRALLAPDDQYVVVPGATRIELFDAGVRAAVGEVVVITEAHSAAEPGCLEALVTRFDDDRVHAAAAEPVPAGSTPFADRDAVACADGLSRHASPSDWRKALPHALAVRRESLLAVGGYATDFDNYGEELLGVALRRAGMPIVGVPEALVRHRFARSPAEALLTTRGLARGQAIARTRTVPDEFDKLLHPTGGLPPVEVDRRIGVTGVAGALTARAPLADLRGWLGPSLLPRAVTRHADGARLRVARLRGRAWRSGPRLDQAYLDMVEVATRHSRRQILATHGPPVRAGLDGAGRWPTDAIDAAQLDGVYDAEVFNGQRFAWLSPLTLLVTDLPAGHWRLRLHTGGFGRDPLAAGLRIRLDGRPLPRGAVSIDESVVTVAVPANRLRPGRPQCWVLVTDPLVPPPGSGDERRLGLPLVSVEVDRA